MLGCRRHHLIDRGRLALPARSRRHRCGLTQHRTDPRLGPLALDLLARGYDAKTTLSGVLAVAPHRDWRQLAIIDRDGGTAAFTGAHVDGAKSGETHGRDCVAIANIVRSTEVPDAMVRAFEADPARPLAERLIEALAAARRPAASSCR